MQIDWFTFVAQVVNFLILVYLLKRFLYGPILAAVDRRQETVEARLEEARQTRQQAEQELESHRQERRELERRRDEILEEARADAEERKRELMREVREEVEEARRRWREAIEREKREYLADLRERVGRRVFAVARRALADLADEEIERRMVRAFLDRLARADDRDEMLEAGLDASTRVRVRSSFELPDDLGVRVVGVVREVAGDPDLEVELETERSVICGVELRAPGVRVAWSVRDYLESLEELFFSGAEGVIPEPPAGEEATAVAEREGAEAREASRASEPRAKPSAARPEVPLANSERPERGRDDDGG